jgi:hypothetical protein
MSFHRPSAGGSALGNGNGIPRTDRSSRTKPADDEDSPPVRQCPKGEAGCFPASLADDLTAHRTAALRVMLAERPTVALAAAMHALVLAIEQDEFGKLRVFMELPVMTGGERVWWVECDPIMGRQRHRKVLELLRGKPWLVNEYARGLSQATTPAQKSTGCPSVGKRNSSPSPTRWDTFSAPFCSSRRCAGKDLPRDARLARGNGRYHTQDLGKGPLVARQGPTTAERLGWSPTAHLPPMPPGRRGTNKHWCNRARPGATQDCVHRSAPHSSRP